MTPDMLADLIDGKLDWHQVVQLMRLPKDPGRFQLQVAVLQQRVKFRERILLPLGEHLFIVDRDGVPLVKCDCGHAFADYRENWKLHALVYVRNTAAALAEIYPGPRSPDPAWTEIREFYCPGCAALLEVDCVPPGYPIVFDFLPDLEAFYRDWLGAELSCPVPPEDRSARPVARWWKAIAASDRRREPPEGGACG